MVFSVWNGPQKRYDYYQAGDNGYGKAPDTGHLSSGSTVAAVRAGYRLPPGARMIGSGDVAKGMIASIGGGSALGGFVDGGAIGLVVLAFFIWKVAK